MNIQEIAELVIVRLKVEGFIIQRYNSYSSASIYLKLDYGVANTIRISDHKGKKQYQYRYNLIKGRNGVDYHKSPQGWARWYYGFDVVDKMIKTIVDTRTVNIKRYGLQSYKRLMENNVRTGKDKTGFWSQCWEV